MKLIDELRRDHLQARKVKDELKKNLLSTLIGDCCKDKKEPDDDRVLATIKSFIAKAKELQVQCASASESTVYINKAFAEISILQSYQPQQLTRGGIHEIIYTLKELVFVAHNENIDLPYVMKYFKTNYPNAYDGKLVSTIAKEML